MSLLPQHQQLIDDSKIDEKFVVGRGYRSIEDPEELRAMGFTEEQRRVPCLYVPGWNLEGELVSHSIRPDSPRLNAAGKVVKYDRPYGSKNYIDCNPAMPREWLTDPAHLILLTEGMRKVDSGLSEGHLTLGLMGVWGWVTKIGSNSTIVPDFRLLQMANRVFYIAYDSDAITKLPVYQAQVELGQYLDSKGAAGVGYVFYPDTTPGEKIGIDDWRQMGRTIQELIDDFSPTIPMPPPDLNKQLDKFDFYAYGESNKYIYIPTGALWPAEAIDKQVKRVPIPGGDMEPTRWLSMYHNVQQKTWAPGEPEVITGRLVTQGGWVEKADARCYNEYRRPAITGGDAGKAQPWLDHIAAVYPENVDHIVSWFAYKVQRPGEKVNHALVLGGVPGIGKDTIIEPVSAAIGPWNFGEVTPAQMAGRFNDFLKKVILRVSELRDMGETNRFGFYEHMKAYTAAPPEFLRVDAKYQPEFVVPNVVGIVYTTNHRTSGLYLPPDDRRHYVAWSELTVGALNEAYFNQLYDWYRDGGIENVAALLRSWDLSGFDPKAPPLKTPAFWDIVDGNLSGESQDLVHVLEAMGWPEVVTTEQVAAVVEGARAKTAKSMLGDMTFEDDLATWIKAKKNARQVPHRMEEAGYVKVVNDAAKDGRWKLGDGRAAVYASRSLSRSERLRAVEAFQSRFVRV